MKIYFKLWMAALFFISQISGLNAAELGQTLLKGQATTFSFEYELGDVATANPKVCDYLVGQDRRSLYLNGRGNGETTVTIWDAAGTKRDEIAVRVVSSTLKDVYDRTRQEFGELSGIEIKAKEGRVEIEGTVAEPDDFRRIEGAARQDPKIKNRVRLSGDVISQVAAAIKEAVNIPGITVRSVRDRVVLEGIAYSASDAKRAVEIARLYSPEVLDLIDVNDTRKEVGRGRMVELSFHMMEIKKGALRELGINWAPGAMQAGSSSGTASASGAGLLSSIGEMGKDLLGFVLGFIPKLKMIRERGDGRVLENPSVIVKSGETAKIFSGTEVPYYRGQDVQFKKMGIEIEAWPIETADGIDLKLAATISSPSGDLRGALDTNTVSTTALVKFGQSLVLGNIIRNGDVKMKNKVPRDLQTSSAIFTLFLSKDFQSNRSEFVIFVTPRLVTEISTAEAELREFLAMEEAMIRDRSKKEFAAYSAKRDGVKNEGEVEETRKRKHRRWR